MAEVVLPFLPLFDGLDEPPAAPGTPPPPDAGARASALDIRRSFVVEAPAGSGKTGLLIQRFLKLLADDSVTAPEQVLAITFTLKATAEMRERVLSHLQAAAGGTDPAANDFGRQTRELAEAVLSRDRLLGWNLLDQPHRLNLRTIDSVCAEIARSLPVLSGSGGRLSPAADAGPLHREAARRTLLLLGGEDARLNDALRNLLLHRDGNLADCETLLADMLALREQWGEFVPLTAAGLEDAVLDATVLPRLNSALEESVCAGLTRLTRAVPAPVLHQLAYLAGHLGHENGYKGEPNPIALCAGLHTEPGETAEHLAHWRALIHLLTTKGGGWRAKAQSNHLRLEIAKVHAAELNAILESLRHREDILEAISLVRLLPPAQYPANQWAVAKSLFRVLHRASIELQMVFAVQGQADFTELSLLAGSALRTGSGADDFGLALGASLQHLLVDEMQDTSSGQYELIQLLSQSWDGHSQTVFLVGDPRQSIYLFRQARVERFVQVLRTGQLGELPLTRLRLTANFRSQRTLVDHFNEDFRSIFPASAAEPLPYASADAVLQAAPAAASRVWHANPVDPYLHTEVPAARLRQQQARRDAAEIVRTARDWLGRPLSAGRTEPWRIAVLVRNRSHLAEIVPAFDHLGVPYRAVEITPLSERQEVLDLTALTRALLHPADRIAGLAILRAPWCGLTLHDLHTLAGSDDPALADLSVQHLLEARGDLLSEDANPRIRRVWDVLTAAATQRTRGTLAQLVERAWRSLGGHVFLSATEQVNAQRFFTLLDQLETEGAAVNASLLDARLQRLFAEPATFAPGTPFVELLTMHKAKGLEWDAVLVPALNSGVGFTRTRLLTWSELDTSNPASASVMLAPIAAKGEEVDELTTWLKKLHRQREAAERKRLFYVAATRAREELHLFAAPNMTKSGELSTTWDSLLRAAWPAAEPHFAHARQTRLVTETPAGVVVFPVPSPPAPAAEADVFDLAAAGEPALEVSRRVLQRLPLAFDPAAAFSAARAVRLAVGDSAPTVGHSAPAAGHSAPAVASAAARFPRPEGSFAARGFGNAVHAFVELLAERLAAGFSVSALLAELPTWHGRIRAVLRADGMPPATVERLTRDGLTALTQMLRDKDGLWLLRPHPGAASELALTDWSSTDAPATLRVDRVFRAGREPHVPGTDTLWIVDFKSATHGASGLAEFLAAQRATYAPQLEAYARVLASTGDVPPAATRLALYYPMLAHLLWWDADEVVPRR